MRGMLPVNPLNRVLEEFRDWKCPTLMLVGNHDQVRHILQSSTTQHKQSALLWSSVRMSESGRRPGH